MELNKKMNELFYLLNQNKDIKRIDDLKSKITDNELSLIQNYRNNPNLENKKNLYNNFVINEYLICESNINYLIMKINQKFKRSKPCPKL